MIWPCDVYPDSRCMLAQTSDAVQQHYSTRVNARTTLNTSNPPTVRLDDHC